MRRKIAALLAGLACAIALGACQLPTPKGDKPYSGPCHGPKWVDVPLSPNRVGPRPDQPWVRLPAIYGPTCQLVPTTPGPGTGTGNAGSS